MRQEFVIVPLKALEVFIDHARQMHASVDYEYLCSPEEFEESAAEFSALVAALKLPE